MGWSVLIASIAFGARAPVGLEAEPEAPVSADLVELGRRLFHDPAASASGRSACASCHDPEHGFSDPAVFSFDEGVFTPRHSQSLVDLDPSQALHWDGSILRLEDAVAQRVSSTPRRATRGSSSNAYYARGAGVFVRVHSARMRETLLPKQRPTADRDLGWNFVEVAPVLEGGSVTLRLQVSQRYRDAHPQLGDANGNPSEPLVADAIAAYVKSLRSEVSPIDRVMAGEALVISAAAERGLVLFRGRAGCAACHLLEPEGGKALLRDGAFHNTGVSWLSEKQTAQASPELTDADLEEMPLRVKQRLLGRDASAGGPTSPEPEALRRAWQAILRTNAADPGQGRTRSFKTPSLRDVARRPPYMHDGSMGTLGEVVKHYASGCGDDPQRDKRLRGFQADEQDVADLVAFLEALSGVERAGLAQLPWRERAERVRLTLLDAQRRPLPDVDLECVPAGDQASRACLAECITRLRTDAKGQAEAPFGSRTHLRVRLPGGIRPVGGDLIPDTCREATLEIPVRGRATFTVVLEGGVGAPLKLHVYRVSEPLSRAALTAAAATALANGVTIFAGAEVVAVDPDAWTLQRVAAEERWPLGAPPGERAETVATYEAYVPASRSEAWVRFPGEWAARKFDLADPSSLR